MASVQLLPLEASDREQFILDNQEAFKYGALEEFGLRDDHLDDEGEIISKETIERSIEHGTAYRIVLDGKKVGGLVLTIDGKHGELDLLFVSPKEHSKGIGYGAWCAVEAMYPEIEVWETCTPYFEKRNIHFYVNRCGFKIDEFWCEHFRPQREIMDMSTGEKPEGNPEEGPDEMFHFIKKMK